LKNLQSSDDEMGVSKIDEEYVDQLSSMNFCERKRTSKVSNPIHIGHHTVSGHEALNLAKRLSEELATHNQSQGGLTRAMSPEVEPISRSYDKKGNIFLQELLSNVIKRLNSFSFNNFSCMLFFAECLKLMIFVA
jgi:hypothetical protein